YRSRNYARGGRLRFRSEIARGVARAIVTEPGAVAGPPRGQPAWGGGCDRIENSTRECRIPSLSLGVSETSCHHSINYSPSPFLNSRNGLSIASARFRKA